MQTQMKQRGFSILELMISLLLGLVVVAGIVVSWGALTKRPIEALRHG